MPKFIAIVIVLGLSLFAASIILDLEPKNKARSPVGQLGASFNQLFEKSKEQAEKTRLRGEEHDQINFLFLGIGGEEHISGNYLTDTVILTAFIPSTQKTAVISIPRDFLVRSPDKTYFTRINSLYAIPRSASSGQTPLVPDPHGEIYAKFPGPMGVEYTKEAIRNITGIEIDYYAVLDLAGVEKIVDILGGINVRRLEDLEDNYFPDDNYEYETYEIKEGWRYLDGKEAAKYIRTRHTAGGDFDRMKRQQEVALAIKKKIAGLQSLSGLPKLLSLYQALQDHFTADLKFNEIMRLMELGEQMKSDAIVFERITADLPAGTVPDALLVTDQVLLGEQKASILKPRAGVENYEEIQAKVADIISSLK